ncbi:MAG: YciI family protein [Opitutus sp.]
MTKYSEFGDQTYLLLFRNAGLEVHRPLSANERLQLTVHWNEWYDTLAAQRRVEQGRPLAPQGKVVSGVHGHRVVDGPYVEGKEVIGGYLLVRAVNLDEATEIAKGCPSLPLGVTVEVRPVSEFSQVLEGVRGHGP